MWIFVIKILIQYNCRAYLELIPSAGHDVMTDTPLQLNTMAGKFIKKWNVDPKQNS